jgi:hypothetical protein
VDWVFGTDRVKRRRISAMADDMRQLRAEQVRILALSQAIRGRAQLGDDRGLDGDGGL